MNGLSYDKPQYSRYNIKIEHATFSIVRKIPSFINNYGERKFVIAGSDIVSLKLTEAELAMQSYKITKVVSGELLFSTVLLPFSGFPSVPSFILLVYLAKITTPTRFTPSIVTIIRGVY